MTIIELKLSTAIKEAGDIEDVRLMKEDAEYILGLLKKADDALNLMKEWENEYEKGFNDAMQGKRKLMYEGIDGKWHKKDW